MKVDDITRCAFFAPDPELMKVDFSDLDKKAKERRAERDADNPAVAGTHPDKTPSQELQRLRREVFNLSERAKNTEIYTNERAGQVKLLESNIAHALQQKKNAAVAGNLLAERNAEHTIKRTEHERDEAVQEFERARKVSAGAAVALKEWPHHARLKELQTSLGA